MPSEHAKLSASGASRWIGCPGSVGLEEKLTTGMQSSSSPFAMEGTCAHELADICLKTGDKPQKYIGKFLSDEPTIQVTAEMAEYVETYVNFCLELGGSLMPEQRVNFSRWVKGGFGTSDCIILKDDEMIIVDLKYGKGVRVDAPGNPQGRLYALGAYDEYSFIFDNIKTITSIIHQPRLDHISSETLSVDDLLNWADEVVVPAAKLALSNNAPFNPSEKACKWCKAQGSCKAQYEFACDLLGSEFDNLDLKDADKLQLDDVAKVLPHITVIKKWFEALENRAKHSLEGGEEVKGYKLVEGRATRKWCDEEKAINLLGVNAFEKKLLSPSKAEKITGKQALKGLVYKPQGKPTLAKENDKRPPINIGF